MYTLCPPLNFWSENASDRAQPTLLLTLVSQTHSPLALASLAPWALGRRDPTPGSTRPPSTSPSTSPWLSQDLAAPSFTSNSFHRAFWTITLLPDVGYRGAPGMSRRHLNLREHVGMSPCPGGPGCQFCLLYPAPFSLLGQRYQTGWKGTAESHIFCRSRGVKNRDWKMIRTWAVGRNSRQIDTEPVLVTQRGLVFAQ